jgi:uncharacterized delta-60 repeat protein
MRLPKAIGGRAWFQAMVTSVVLLLLISGGVSGELWVQHYGFSTGNDVASAVATDALGNIFVTGPSFGSNTQNFATLKYSSDGVPLWTNRYNGPGTADRPVALGVDTKGDVIVAGSSTSTNGNFDYAVIKYSNSGVPLWTNRYDGAANADDTLVGMAIGRDGTVFVTGASATPSSRPFTVPINYDYATLAYSSAGAPLWTNSYSGFTNGNDYSTAIAVDADGNVLVTGYSAAASGSFDFATLKYSSSGAAVWTNRYHAAGPGDDFPNALAVDNNRNVFVTGRVASTSIWDYGTIKYSSDGAPLWTNAYSGPPNSNQVDEPQAVAVDRNGNAFVTGYSAGEYGFPDYLTIKYSQEGVPLWTNRYSQMTNGSDVATAIAIDESGNVFVTGFSDGGSTSEDIATVAYSTDGLALWTNRYSSVGNYWDQAHAITLDPIGNVIVVGQSESARSGFDFTVLKYGVMSRPRLMVERMDAKLILRWAEPGLTLQASGQVNGTFTNLTGFTSPYTNTMPAPEWFFRLVAP